jgi:hypothetical protein
MKTEEFWQLKTCPLCGGNLIDQEGKWIHCDTRQEECSEGISPGGTS